jgi:enolase-phosphatase E1
MIQFDEPLNTILLDIEGATTPIDFVHRTLFPYARRRLGDYLSRHISAPDVQEDLADLRAENELDRAKGLNPPVLEDGEGLLESSVAYLEWLMDRDRKSTPLKSLQGKIWEEGYRAGQLKSAVFDDVPRAFERWRKQDKRIFIYSSGSVLAQKLLFAHTSSGDLGRFIDGYFDTTIGGKKDAASYRRIAETLAISPREILFISDSASELDAADSAGLQTLLSIRPGNSSQGQPIIWKISATFDDVFP